MPPAGSSEAYFALRHFHYAALERHWVSADQIQTAILMANPGLAAKLAAIGIGAVFFGAATYLGNGPNFMVKSIAEQQRAPVPDFTAYILKYTLPFLLPTLVVVWWLFF
jgi:Na+/H+ antiporter NhaD/arsenite permease-like protein